MMLPKLAPSHNGSDLARLMLCPSLRLERWQADVSMSAGAVGASQRGELAFDGISGKYVVCVWPSTLQMPRAPGDAFTRLFVGSTRDVGSSTHCWPSHRYRASDCSI